MAEIAHAQEVEPHQKRPARGQPVLFLGTILIVWAAARTMMLQPDAYSSDIDDLTPEIAGRPASPVVDASASENGPVARYEAPSNPDNMRAPRQIAWNAGSTGQSLTRSMTSAQSLATLHSQQDWLTMMVGNTNGRRPLLLQNPIDLSVSVPDRSASVAQTASPPTTNRASKWALYAWTLYRQGSGQNALASNPSYGASQAGAILRYRPLGNGRLAPEFFARASSALQTSQHILAFGASVQPFGFVPARLSLEYRRALGDDGRSGLAAGLAGGFSEDALPGQVKLDGYGQFGVVGTKRPDYFFDLQMVATKTVAQTSDYALALGGGIWAGGQSDALSVNNALTYRVDAGPRAALNLPIDQGFASLAVDWRQRVAGNASPDSGMALTLATDF